MDDPLFELIGIGRSGGPGDISQNKHKCLAEAYTDTHERGVNREMPTTHHASKETERLYERLYERYGKPLEAEHTGEYLAVSPKGQTILGTSLRDVARQATTQFGPGNFLYKVGETAVGKWR